MDELDRAAFQRTPLVREPFDHLVVPGFVRAEAREAIGADFPAIDKPGSFPVCDLSYGPAFAGLVGALGGDEFRAACEEKFGVSLKGRPTTVTVRGRCGTRDGFIHTDSVNKIITVLLYLNSGWDGGGGCLRLLRSADDIDDVAAEVPPRDGTLVAFRRGDNSWHGHKPFVGPRRVVQFNWVSGRGVQLFETLRHRASALLKKCNLWSGESLTRN